MRAVPSVAALLVCVLSHSPQSDVAAYRRVIDDYRAGADVTSTRFSTTVDPIVIARIVETSSGWTADDLAAAAMFHTDASLRLIKAARKQDAASHVDAAVTLLHAAVDREPDRAEYAVRWRSTTTGLLYAADARDLAAHAREATEWIVRTARQDDADAAFALGLTSEIRAAVVGPLSGPPPRRNAPVSMTARRDLDEAARHFEDALTADPGRTDAALHLGRILLVSGRDAEAGRPLLTAAAAPSRPVRYLAMLFLGALAERQSRFADAERQYRAALELFPWGQSAPFALSHLLMRDGREAEARAAIEQHLTATALRVVDPLWTYLADPATDLGPTLTVLRAEMWR